MIKQIMATYLILLFPLSLFPARRATGIPITQVPSIHQEEYTDSIGTCAANILLSIYNGEAMLNKAYMLGRGKRRINPRFVTKPKEFDNWMTLNSEALKPWLEADHSSVSEKLIRMLLPQSECYQQHCSIVTLKKLGSFSPSGTDNTLNFVDKDNRILEVITAFRGSQDPHLVIFDVGGHWISVLVRHNGCIVADSSDIDRTKNTLVGYLYNIFLNFEILEYKPPEEDDAKVEEAEGSASAAKPKNKKHDRVQATRKSGARPKRCRRKS